MCRLSCSELWLGRALAEIYQSFTDVFRAPISTLPSREPGAIVRRQKLLMSEIQGG